MDSPASLYYQEEDQTLPYLVLTRYSSFGFINVPEQRDRIIHLPNWDTFKIDHYGDGSGVGVGTPWALLGTGPGKMGHVSSLSMKCRARTFRNTYLISSQRNTKYNKLYTPLIQESTVWGTIIQNL